MSEARVLNRVIRRQEAGRRYEADQRHVDLIIKLMGNGKGKRGQTVGEDESKWKLDDNDRELGKEEVSLYRVVAARANYLALGRVDIQYATKGCCRGMARPQVLHMSMLKRLARYLVGRPRAVWQYDWQAAEDISVFSDSDWAGCRRTARSTSGGIALRGKHHLKSWSSTQKKVTLSSAEAELAAVVKASTEAIGLTQMAEGFGHEVAARVFVDSSAALSVTQRKGNGKLRPVRIGQLWVQQTAEDGDLAYHKVDGKQNPADVCTKHVNRAIMDSMMDRIGLQEEEGRADLGFTV